MPVVATNIKLETKLVGEVTGSFFIPSYQRGYRWGEIEVIRLLDDLISNGSKPYCLQPIVVRRDGDQFELIDGQQRLTTLYLIYKYIHIASNGWIPAPQFALSYETRGKSKDFLDTMDMSRKDENIDFWFMSNAYETIATWFTKNNQVQAATNINKYFTENVKVIWYEVDEAEDAIALFTRLNIGKIPLTNAELVKAMFLSRGSNGMTREKQEEIALQWDSIERELHRSSLWYFLTNHNTGAYQTRIDLILNLIAEAGIDNRDPYHTFFCFDQMRQTESLTDIWKKIQHTFLILKSWYEEHELYHKIGYLIASGSKLSNLYAISQGRTKRQFREELTRLIKESIAVSGNPGDLSYDKASDYEKITKLLLLFNVESVRRQDESQRFPFDKFKFRRGERMTWSLEHIHAQHSEGMRTQEKWKEWLTQHMKSIRSLGGNYTDLLQDMEAAISRAKLEGKEFEELHRRAVEVLSPGGSDEYLHSIANLALLSVESNAALNNATFDVKRNIIVEMDKEGKYIPYCTRMVFLKYYTPSGQNQLHFWGEADRNAYIQAMNEVLEPYLDIKIYVEKERD